MWAVDGGPSWSPNGRLLAFSGAEYARDGRRTPSTPRCPACEAIFLAGPGGAPQRVPVPIGGAQQPAFVSGGQRLIFTGRTGPHARPQLYSVGIDGTDLVRLTDQGASEGAPCPDGSLVFLHGHALYVRSPNGRIRRLTARGSLPACSPNGRMIAFVRGSALYTISPRGTDLRRVTHGVTVDGRAAFSPTGGLIALTTTHTSPGCHPTIPITTNSLEIIDLQDHLRHRSVIDVEPCTGGLVSLVPAGVSWQALPAREASGDPFEP